MTLLVLGILYSINTPLAASKIENLENTCVLKTRINTMGAYVFYFQSKGDFPSWTSRVRSPSPALRNEWFRFAITNFLNDLPFDPILIRHGRRFLPLALIKGK
jgi:hypothetical protein